MQRDTAVEPALEQLFDDYVGHRIDGTELHERLAELPLEPLNGMSFVQKIIDELEFFSGQSTDTVQFQKLVQLCKIKYLDYLAYEDEHPDGLSFRQFIEQVIERHKAPKREFETVTDIEKFWKLVDSIAKHIH